MRWIEELISQRGVAIVEGDLPIAERGRWYPEARIIVLQKGMPPEHVQTTLSHELGHVEHEHDMSTPDARIHYFQERQADEYAARLLITPESYRAAEAVHGPHLSAIALELGVTVELLHVWRDLWARRNSHVIMPSGCGSRSRVNVGRHQL